MPDDQLSEVFELVEVRGLVSGGFSVRGRWVSRATLQESFKFMAVVAGRAQLMTDGIDAPIELLPGDVAILNNRSRLELSGGTGDGPVREVMPVENGLSLTDADWTTNDIILGGRIDLNETGRTLLLEALPPVAHVRASPTSGANLRGSIHRLFDEVAATASGQRSRSDSMPSSCSSRYSVRTSSRPNSHRAGCEYSPTNASALPSP